MKQLAQRPKDGAISVVDAAIPTLRPGWVLVANRLSLISAGTERTKVVTGEMNLLQKARARPDLVRKVVDRARMEGVGTAISVARDRLSALAPIGYACAGVVVEVGEGVDGIAPGDRVACGGGGWANHAEVVAVPQNLVVLVPTGVVFDDAAYATVGAIALHGVRQADAGIGEWVGVIGLGLVGQLATRILVASGCRVVGIDLDDAAVELARGAGVTALRRDHVGLEHSVRSTTGGLGLDAVLLCASSSSPDPLELAVRLSRDRGRIVVVGETRISVDRGPMYEKELELRMSRSYGPGRYDRDYEERGRDLPPSYVRWTEQRNMQAFLELVAEVRVKPAEVTTHRFAIDDAQQAYALLTGRQAGVRPFGVLLEYAEAWPATAPPAPHNGTRAAAPGAGVALIGAGAFARATLIPALKAAGARLAAVTSEGGLTAADVAARFGFERAAGSLDEILGDESIGAVMIATRHPSHAGLAAAALRAGKAVFVEKPLALNELELLEVEDALRSAGQLMVGFNRRFAPLVERLRNELDGTAGRTLSARVNAGSLPEDHWLHDSEEGGGRLLGEGCHFIDLLAHLAGSRIVATHAIASPNPQRPVECSDDAVATLRLADGTVATLVYSGSGDSGLPKERIEAFGGGLAAVLDNFRRLDLYRRGRRTVLKQRQDKGHRAEVARFLAAVRGDAELPPVETYLNSTRATLALVESLRTGLPVTVP